MARLEKLGSCQGLSPGAEQEARGGGEQPGQAVREVFARQVPPPCAHMPSYLYCLDPAMKIRSEKVGLNSWLFSPFKSRKKGWISRKKRKIRKSALRREI